MEREVSLEMDQQLIKDLYFYWELLFNESLLLWMVAYGLVVLGKEA